MSDNDKSTITTHKKPTFRHFQMAYHILHHWLLSNCYAWP